MGEFKMYRRTLGKLYKNYNICYMDKDQVESALRINREISDNLNGELSQYQSLHLEYLDILFEHNVINVSEKDSFMAPAADYKESLMLLYVIALDRFKHNFYEAEERLVIIKALVEIKKLSELSNKELEKLMKKNQKEKYKDMSSNKKERKALQYALKRYGK